jgi:hypothetical protein
MVTYEVTATVDAARVAEYETYMRRHVPDVVATGCFAAACLEKAAPGRYRVQYGALSQADLDRYLRDHAPRLRADFAEHFPQGVELTREVWGVVDMWPKPQPGDETP